MRPAANRKPSTYRCPLCGGLLPALSAHMLVVPEGQASRRRHAHTECVVGARKAGRLPLREDVDPPGPGLPARVRGVVRTHNRRPMRVLSLALKFVIELAAFAAFGYWGASVGSGATAVVSAIAAPAVAITLWGLFAAPRSERRLATAARIPFELSIFGLAIIALFVAGAPAAAVVLAVLVVTSTVLLTRFDQWEA